MHPLTNLRLCRNIRHHLTKKIKSLVSLSPPILWTTRRRTLQAQMQVNLQEVSLNCHLRSHPWVGLPHLQRKKQKREKLASKIRKTLKVTKIRVKAQNWTHNLRKRKSKKHNRTKVTMLNFRKNCASSNWRNKFLLMTKRTCKNYENNMLKNKHMMEAMDSVVALGRIRKVRKSFSTLTLSGFYY